MFAKLHMVEVDAVPLYTL